MRWLAVLAVLVSSQAHADPFVELVGGLAAPLADNDWTSVADPGVKLVGRIGSGESEGVGGYLQFDWAPLPSDISVVSLQRFRVQAGIQLRHRVAPKIVLAGRLSAGIDVLHEHTDVTPIPLVSTLEGSDNDLGIAFEAAGGLWFAVGATTHLGFEVAFPIGVHFSKANPTNPSDPNNPKVDYTAVDLDLLFGVRLGIWAGRLEIEDTAGDPRTGSRGSGKLSRMRSSWCFVKARARELWQGRQGRSVEDRLHAGSAGAEDHARSAASFDKLAVTVDGKPMTVEQAFVEAVPRTASCSSTSARAARVPSFCPTCSTPSMPTSSSICPRGWHPMAARPRPSRGPTWGPPRHGLRAPQAAVHGDAAQGSQVTIDLAFSAP